MPTQLTLQLEHNDSSETLVDATVAAKVFSAILEVISELDRAVTGATGVVGWKVSTAKIGSLGLGLQPYLRDQEKFFNLDSLSSQHAKTIGAISTQTQKGEVALSDKSLKKIKKSISDAQEANCRLWIGQGNDFHKYEVTSLDITEVDNTKTTFSIGSLEGNLEYLNTHDDKKIVFAIWDYVGNRIECQYNRDDNLYDEMLQGIDRRVRVFGRIRRSHSGVPRHVDVEKLQILRDTHKLPTLEDMIGIVKLDSSGSEYVRSLRDA